MTCTAKTKEVQHVNMCHAAMQAVSGFIYLFIFAESVVYNDALLGKVTKMTYVQCHLLEEWAELKQPTRKIKFLELS